MPTPSEVDAAYLRELAGRLEETALRDDAARLLSVARRLESVALPAGAPAPGRGLVRYERIDDEEDGPTFLLVVEAGGVAGALVINQRPGAASPRVYGGPFRAGAARAPAHGLLAALSPLDATAGRIRQGGLPTDDADGFRRGVMASLVRFAIEAAAVPSPNQSAFLGRAVGEDAEGPEGWFRKMLGREPKAVPAGTTDAPVLDLAVEPGPDGTPPALVDPGLDGWVAAATAALRPSGLPWPDHRTWEHRGHAFFSAPGEAGRYRRQAARAIPALAETLYETDRVTRAIDAGGPVFEVLRERLAAFVPAHARGDLTTAKLRRLRVHDRPLATWQSLDDVVAAIACLPLHLLPTTTRGWQAFFLHGVDPARMLGRIQVEAGPLMRRYAARWLDPDAPPPPADDEALGDAIERIRTSSDGLRDMLESFATGVLPSLGIGVPTARRCAVAARALLRPHALDAALALQARWHAGLPAFQAVQAADPALRWPALFDDYRQGRTLVTCLTSEAELVAEGQRGPDADGVNGLEHCVGTYARRCLAGECHVASVRWGDPGYEVRLSTLEIEIVDGVPLVRQHYGRGNGRPPHPSEQIVRTLMPALRSGRLLRPLPPRSPAGSPGQLPQASPEVLFEAWKPYLPPRVARGGLPALRALLAADPAVAAAGGLPEAA